MAENTAQRAAQEKVITLEALQEAAPLIATKAEVTELKNQVNALPSISVTYATSEEIKALFQEPAAESGGE